jgi:photosystem II stability/assembly factor-like uncharacterized protein
MRFAAVYLASFALLLPAVTNAHATSGPPPSSSHARASARALALAPALAPARTAASPATPDSAALASVHWRNIGPANFGGRVTDFAVAIRMGRPQVIYVASAGGGVFRSADQGATWTPVFDHAGDMLSIGAVAVSASDPNVVWVGTGEATNRQSSQWGDGVFRSEDGGDTWKDMGLAGTRNIGRIVIDPTNPAVVYVAATGHLFGPNPERGVYKTTDGGATWTRSLFVDDNTGAIDLVMDPHAPNTLFAAMYQRRRRAWGFDGGGPGSGIYRTTDAGRSWQRLSGGLPTGAMGRIGLAVDAQDGRMVYAVVEAGHGRSGVYRSLDRGDSWTRLSDVNPRPMYFSQIRIDPQDPQRIYLAGNSVRISDDGGRTFPDPGYGVTGVHPDQHAIWIDPTNPDHVMVGNDGGVTISWDRARTWRMVTNLPIGQFYHVATDMRSPYDVCGGLQDNGAWCMPSDTYNKDGISNRDVHFVGGADGFRVEVDPTDPNTVYPEFQGGNVSRLNLATGERQDIRPAEQKQPDPKKNPGYRWNWNAPFIISAHDPHTLYMGANLLFKSTDQGRSWKVISPDLTYHLDRDTLPVMGRPVTDSTLSKNDGVSSYGTITAIAESPVTAGVLYTGSDDGRIEVTRDDGASWIDITPNIPKLPRLTVVSSIEASHKLAGRVYATFDDHYSDDYAPYVYVSDDYGKTWRPITHGLPQMSVNRIIEDPVNPYLLFLGHEAGAAVSLDAGQSWTTLNTDLPPVSVKDLAIQTREHDLIAATHGRGFYILDDISALEAMTPQFLASSQATMLPSRPAATINRDLMQRWFEVGRWSAANAPGAIISYYLPGARAGAGAGATITISGPNGDVVRTLHGPAAPGLDRVDWDLRVTPPFRPDSGEVFGAFSHPPRGPWVMPGTYRVAVSVPGAAPSTAATAAGQRAARGGGHDGARAGSTSGVDTGAAQGARTLTGDIVVKTEPGVQVSTADLQARHDVLMRLYAAQQKLATARDAARRVDRELKAVKANLASATDSAVTPAIRDSVAVAADTAAAVLGDIGQKLGAAGRVEDALDGYTGAPTPDQKRQADWAYQDAVDAINRLNDFSRGALTRLYHMLEARGLWPASQVPPLGGGG